MPNKGITDSDGLLNAVMTAINIELQQLGNNLELRIANYLRLYSNLPAPVVINISKGVGTDIGSYIFTELYKSGRVEDEVRKML